MATSIRWPADVLTGMKSLAGEHGRSLHSEVIQACRAWMKRYAKESNVINPKLVQAIRAEIAQSREEGANEQDIKWMAAGAAIRFGREQGIIGESVSDEMAAAIEEVVKQELKK